MSRIDDVLLETGKIPEMAITSAKNQVGEKPDDLWKYFVKTGKVTEKEVFQALAKVLRYKFIDLKGREIPAEVISLLTTSFCRKEHLIPLELKGEKLYIGMTNPNNYRAIDEISVNTYYSVVVTVVAPTDLQETLDRYYRADDEIDKLSEEIEQIAEEDSAANDDLTTIEDDSPIVRFVNLLIIQAIQDRASDIHVEPGERELIVRYRIDGVLHIMQRADKNIQNGVVSRLKVMSDIDIGERRKPQDGRLSVRHSGQSVDIRVVTLPTTWGEKVVMRILDHSTEKRSIDSISMSENNERIFKNALSKPHGMILVTGPTGSGKSLPLSAKIPTPNGFTTMGEIEQGDQVFGSDGKVYSVTSTSEINPDAEMFEITFSDGQKVVADADHQWLVSTAAGRAVKKSKRKDVAIEDYLKAHQAFTKLASLSLEFTPEFGKRTSEELLNLMRKENIQHYSSSREVEQALHMVDVMGDDGSRPSSASSLSMDTVIEYSIEEALMGLARRARQQHAVIQSKDTPVVRTTTREMLENGIKEIGYAVPFADFDELLKNVGTSLKDKARIAAHRKSKTDQWNYISAIKPLGVEPAKCISVSSPDFTYLVGEDFVTTSNSTTIYTALDEVSQPDVNVVTVEDPVEKKIAGISQMQINNKAGMTFSNALRSILRADPDIIFLGEIRDQETAKIAVDASMTGHLVLSTLHTNGAPEAAARLSEMGVEPYLVGNSVSCVVAQRLARRLCNDCKKPIETDYALLEKVEFPPKFDQSQLYAPVGCSSCSNTGYKGRIALTEVLEITTHLEPLIVAQKSATEIREEAEKHGFVSLRNDGWEKVANGYTTIEEVLRVAA